MGACCEKGRKGDADEFVPGSLKDEKSQSDLIERIIKIQAGVRGYRARKELQSLRAGKHKDALEPPLSSAPPSENNVVQEILARLGPYQPENSLTDSRELDTVTNYHDPMSDAVYSGQW